MEYKKRAKQRKLQREFETAFYEGRYIFLFVAIIILFYNFI